MAKRRQQVLNSSSEDDNDSDIETNKRVRPASSDSSTEGSDLEWTVAGGASVKQKKKLTAGGGATHDTDRVGRNSSNSPGDSSESGEDKSDRLNGDDSFSDSLQYSDSGTVSQEESTSGADEFNDGLDSALMGGPEDKAKLDQMTEAEREQEIYRRLELRERLEERKKIYYQMKRVRREAEKKERPDKSRERNEKKRIQEERELLIENSRRSERKRKQTDVKRLEAIDQLKQNRLLQREKQDNEIIGEDSDHGAKRASPQKKRQYRVRCE